MGKQWIAKEQAAIAHIRNVLKKEIANRPQFPEVVGDRRILRFVRGKQGNVEEATKMYKDFLQWRLDNNVDAIRQDILYGGKDSPYEFPYGKTIIELAPQIVISVNSMDKKGQPLSLEQFDFKPSAVFKAITLDNYLLFLIYTLEYRALVLEQLSVERERKYLEEHPQEADRVDGYGFIVMLFIIRDLKGVGMAHLGSEGRALVSAALKLGLPNYQEYMGNSAMVNVPWVFTTFWYFVKGLLDEFILSKLTLVGTDYMETLLKEMNYEHIPKVLGGGFTQYNERFEFDLSPNGAFWYEGCNPEPPKKALTNGTTASNKKVTISNGNNGHEFTRGGMKMKRDLSALHKTSVHFPTTDALTEVENEDDADDDNENTTNNTSSNSGKKHKKSKGILNSLKQSGKEIIDGFRYSPVFSLLLISILIHMCMEHKELLISVLLPGVVLFVLLSLLLAPHYSNVVV